MKKIAISILVLLISSLLFACSTDRTEVQSKIEQVEASAGASTQSFTDSLGNEVEVPTEVHRIVTLSTEMLMLLADLGVNVVGTVDSHMHLPEEEGIPKVGGINEVNLEQVISLEPDLVIGTPRFHSKLLPSMAENRIPMAIMQMVTFDDVKQVARTYGKILGIEDTVEQKIAEAQQRVDAAIAKASAVIDKKSVVLNVTPGGISIQKSGTTTLEVVGLLGIKNVADELPSLPDSANAAPFSMETLVELQPDYIFITVHGATETGTEIIESQLKANPAWQTLQAVKNNQIHVLPSNLFLTNPGLHYEQTVQYMVDIISQ